MQKPFKQIKIGALSLSNNVVAAPLAGLSSLPYRVFAMEMGCALAFSEMVSAEGFVCAKERTRAYFENDDSARPYGLQFFSAKPDYMFEAVSRIDKSMADLIDINMGCPVKKVCSKGAGSALMKNLPLAEKLISAARRATNLPLTVKFRSGWDDASVNCVDFARMAEAAGADAVIVHPRTREQMFKGKSNWAHIADVKRAVGIPVIGNGDVKTRDDALRMLYETACDGVMVGRAAVGNPWIFREIVDGSADVAAELERGTMALRHFEILSQIMGGHRAVLKMRSILPWYVKGIYGSRAFLNSASSTKTPEALTDLMRDFFDSQ